MKYSEAFKKQVLDHVRDHSYAETSRALDVSEPTIAKWANRAGNKNPNGLKI